MGGVWAAWYHDHVIMDMMGARRTRASWMNQEDAMRKCERNCYGNENDDEGDGDALESTVSELGGGRVRVSIDGYRDGAMFTLTDAVLTGDEARELGEGIMDIVSQDGPSAPDRRRGVLSAPDRRRWVLAAVGAVVVAGIGAGVASMLLRTRR